MTLVLDHIAIACTNLQQGADWVAERLGVALQPGGQHLAYGTHNMLLGMGDIYLEVIAPDPSQAHDGPSWFGLRDFSGQPRPANWICQTTDFSLAPPVAGPPRRLQRGDLSWQITVPDDGSLPWQGAYPTLLQWDAGVTPPTQSLPDSGVRLRQWDITHPDATRIAGMLVLPEPRVRFHTGPFDIKATFETRDGLVTL